jgi:hypothetical protein
MNFRFIRRVWEPLVIINTIAFVILSALLLLYDSNLLVSKADTIFIVWLYFTYLINSIVVVISAIYKRRFIK